jgi:Fe-S cluster assembly iron-binding protein IscA
MKVTQEAREKLREFLEDYGDGGFVRVSRLVSGGGCCAKLNLGVSLDDERNEENDLFFAIGDLPIVIEKNLHAALPEIEISYDEDRGIIVSNNNAVGT